MGILNLTPDSFSDGGQWLGKTAAVQHALAMQDAGADIIDVGGESTRPGAKAVSLQQELDRVIPVIESIVPQLRVPVSIDTSKPEVMRAAMAAGAGMINDVYALRSGWRAAGRGRISCPGVPDAHGGGPARDAEQPRVRLMLRVRLKVFCWSVRHCVSAAGSQEKILCWTRVSVLAKPCNKTSHSFMPCRRLRAAVTRCWSGVSRKAMIGQLTGREISGRIAGSITAAALAAQMGVAIVRVHDVAETHDALKVATALWQG